MRLSEILAKSTHDYTGTGDVRICARWCGAYFFIFRDNGAPNDVFVPGCRVPDGVDVFGECPKTDRPRVETRWVGKADHNGTALVLTCRGSDLDISVLTPPMGEEFNYYVTPDSAIDLLEWLARQLKATIQWDPKSDSGRQEPNPRFVVGQEDVR